MLFFGQCRFGIYGGGMSDIRYAFCGFYEAAKPA